MTEAGWLAASHLYDRIRWLEKLAGTDRRLRLFACACCRRVWDLLRCDAARRIVELSEAYADGGATPAELQAANHSPEFAEYDAVVEGTGEVEIQSSACVLDAVGAARLLATPDLSGNDITHIVQNTTRQTANDFIRSSRNFRIGRTPGCDESALKEEERILLDIFGNPFRPATLDPSWLTSTVVALARGIYDDRAFDRLPILADALQDAGCEHADVLAHCRSDGPHVRGCWVVDLILGKS